MYKVIVVGTDGSDTASVAVNHGVELANLAGATLHIVHAYQMVSPSQVAMATTVAAWNEDLQTVNDGIAAEGEVVCERSKEQALRAGVKVETHARPGDPADVLVAVAKEVDADLVVLGSRGMTGVRRFVLGSVPNKVSHRCPCNLLIVDTTPA